MDLGVWTTCGCGCVVELKYQCERMNVAGCIIKRCREGEHRASSREESTDSDTLTSSSGTLSEGDQDPDLTPPETISRPRSYQASHLYDEDSPSLVTTEGVSCPDYDQHLHTVQCDTIFPPPIHYSSTLFGNPDGQAISSLSSSRRNPMSDYMGGYHPVSTQYDTANYDQDGSASCLEAVPFNNNLLGGYPQLDNVSSIKQEEYPRSIETTRVKQEDYFQFVDADPFEEQGWTEFRNGGQHSMTEEFEKYRIPSMEFSRSFREPSSIAAIDVRGTFKPAHQDVYLEPMPHDSEADDEHGQG